MTTTMSSSMSSCNERSPLMHLIPECQYHAASYLTYRDLSQLCSTSKPLHDLFLTNPLASTMWMELLHRICPSSIPTQIHKWHNVPLVLRTLCKYSQQGKFFNLLEAVLAVSSMDRSAESPLNVFTPSSCMDYMLKQPQGQRHIITGYYSQRRCGCAGGGAACYWSSAGSPNQAATEFIVFSLQSNISIIRGLAIMPYQAFFHPGAPVYGMQEVAVQVLEVNPKRSYKSFPLPSGRRDEDHSIRYRNTDLDISKDVLYQTEFFPLQNVAERQEIFFQHPLMCVSGEIRLVFRGMYSQQSIGEEGVAANDEYYGCLSYVEVFGIPFPQLILEEEENRVGQGVSYKVVADVELEAIAREVANLKPVRLNSNSAPTSTGGVARHVWNFVK